MTPGPTFHVTVDPDTDAAQVGAEVPPRLPQLADPGTRAVPLGTVSVRTIGSVVVEMPRFCTSKVYVNGVADPAVTTDVDTSLST